MNWRDLPWNPSPRLLRQFAGIWLVVLLALGAHQWFVRGHHTAAIILGVASLIGVAGLLRPNSVRWLFLGATVASFPIGWVVAQVMLAVMFYLVMTPVALMFRWKGRDELHLRRRPDQATFWTERGDPPEPGSYLKQF